MHALSNWGKFVPRCSSPLKTVLVIEHVVCQPALKSVRELLQGDLSLSTPLSGREKVRRLIEWVDD